jgi:hypothetical protein
VPERPAFDDLREAEHRRLHPLEPLVELASTRVGPLPHQPPDPLVPRNLPQRILVASLERLEPHVLACEDYVKRQVPPSSNARRIRRATTILCTSSAPS